MKKIFVYGAVMLIVFLCASCTSTKFTGYATCTGRVCGPHGEPVEHYTVSFGIGEKAVTGANGMFVIPALRAGTYTLTGHGRDWSSIEKEIVFTDRRGIVCIQVEPITMVYQTVESYLRSGLYDEAARLLKSMADGNADSALFQFYQEIVAYNASPSEKKLKKLADRLHKESDYVF